MKCVGPFLHLEFRQSLWYLSCMIIACEDVPVTAKVTNSTSVACHFDSFSKMQMPITEDRTGIMVRH